MPATAIPISTPAQELKQAHACFRSDLAVSRQLDRGEPVYVVHDPVAFRTHRLDHQQYRIAVWLDGSVALECLFQRLVLSSVLNESDEPLFYEFVSKLYQSGLVVLPVHNGAQFYDQYRKSLATKRRGRLMSILFMQIPMCVPDHFLTRTQRYVSWLFSRWCCCAWLVAGLGALTVLAARFADFAQPFNGLLSPANLPLLWCTFVGLKLWHELGHGYACKHFGGYVPEAGTMLVAGNPLAYVDATAAWSFPDRRQRMIVMAGGMYFESLIAIPALFVWAASSPGLIQSLAYQIVVTASVVTVLFNANPLMKFDGYFILSELIRVPNLRSRAAQQVNRCFQRMLLGSASSGQPEKRAMGFGLCAYGAAASVYKVFLVLGIATMVAQRFPLVGIALGAAYVVSALVGTSKKILTYLLTRTETGWVRLRARACVGLLFIGAPAAALVLPVPFPIVTWAVVSAETEYVVRVDTPGEFQGSDILPGQPVRQGMTLVRLENCSVADRLREVRAAFHEATLKWEVVHERDVVESARAAATVQALRKQLQEVQRQHSKLNVASPGHGYVLQSLSENERGSFLKTGDPVGLVADGRPILKAWLTQEQLDDIVADVGSTARLRIPGRSGETYTAQLTRIEPAAASVIHERALSYFDGGELRIDPRTGRPLDALFQIELASETQVIDLSNHGSRVALAFPRRYTTLAGWAVDNCRRFLHELWTT